MKTTDGGVNWYPKTSHTTVTDWLASVFFIDNYTGWVVGTDGTFPTNSSLILKTTDGGESWICGGLGGRYLVSVHFINQNSGWTVGNPDIVVMIKRTTDSGTTWYSQLSGTNRDLTSVFCTNNNTGWIVGYFGTIQRTTDSGNNWVPQTSGTELDLLSVYFVDQNTGWAVGSFGTILKTTNGGVSFIEEEEIDEIPIDYTLSQNYPNPFNPNTKIKYSIPQISYTTIKVFDVLGNEIETLVNGEKSIGTYEITWTVENLSSGNYLYQLRARDFVETKKLILMK